MLLSGCQLQVEWELTPGCPHHPPSACYTGGRHNHSAGCLVSTAQNHPVAPSVETWIAFQDWEKMDAVVKSGLILGQNIWLFFFFRNNYSYL